MKFTRFRQRVRMRLAPLIAKLKAEIELCKRQDYPVWGYSAEGPHIPPPAHGDYYVKDDYESWESLHSCPRCGYVDDADERTLYLVQPDEPKDRL